MKCVILYAIFIMMNSVGNKLTFNMIKNSNKKLFLNQRNYYEKKKLMQELLNTIANKVNQ